MSLQTNVSIRISNIFSFIAILSIASVGLILAAPARAADDSISAAGPIIFILSFDADENSFANIGDMITISATLNNTDDGCVAAGTIVTADLTQYGGTDNEELLCDDNGGAGDVFQLDFVIVDAGDNGIDIPDLDVADDSKITLTATDDDEDPDLGDPLLSGPSDALVAAGEVPPPLNGVDTIAPSFPGIIPNQALKQDGLNPTVATSLWYYYEGQNLRFVSNVSDDDINVARACVLPITSDGADDCEPEDFLFGVANTDYIDFAAENPGSFEFNTPLASLSGLPAGMRFFPLGILLRDDAGNTVMSTFGQSYFTVFGINPKDMVPELGGEGTLTTDWSNIDDFTAVEDLIFNARDCSDGCTDLGLMTLNGPLDLTDSDTVTALQSFGENVSVGGDAMRIDSDTLAAFNGGAELVMFVGSATQPGIIVKDNDGNIVADGYIANDADVFDEFVAGGEGGDTLNGFVWDGEARSLTFNTDGWSEFDTDFTGPEVIDVTPNDGGNSSRSRNVQIEFSEPVDPDSFDMTDSAIGSDSYEGVFNEDFTILTMSHDAWPNNTDVTISITAVNDLVGNQIAEPFTWTFTARTTGGGGGSTTSVTSSTPASLALGSPNGGESLEFGGVAPITWSSTGLASATLRLSLSSDGGMTFPTTISASESNDGAYPWTVPAVSGSSFRVRVEAISGGVVIFTDISDSNFSISAAGTVPTPPNPSSPPPNDEEITGVTSGPSFDPDAATAASTSINDDLNIPAADGPVNCVSGTRIKGSLSTVYYCGADGKRYTFLNENTYFTWYANFSGVLTVSNATLASIDLGGIVLPRPGTRMVKIESDAKTYAVAPGGYLRWVTTEALAAAMYGADWNTKIDDIPVSLWTHFTFGPDITE